MVSIHFATEAALWHVDEPDAWPPWAIATVVLKGSNTNGRGKCTVICTSTGTHRWRRLAHCVHSVQNAGSRTHLLEDDNNRGRCKHYFALNLCVKLTDRKADTSYKVCLGDRVVSLRFSNQVIATNFYRQLSHFIQHSPEGTGSSDAEIAEVSRSGSWIVL